MSRNTPSDTSTELQPGTPGKAAVVDHVGAQRDPYRVTIMLLARKQETYEIRWRVNVRDEDGVVTRERDTAPGGHSESDALDLAKKIHRNLVKSGGYQGLPPRPKSAPQPPPAPKTLSQVADLWLAQHPSNASKPGTIEWYRTLMDTCILPALTYRASRGNRTISSTVELGAMVAAGITITNINVWTNALSCKPDARCKSEARPISSSTVNACLRVLTACLNWAKREGHITANPAAGVEVTVHGARIPEWFRTPDDFWAALKHIDDRHRGFLHDHLVTMVYMGLRVNELSALRCEDIDLPRRRAFIRHNFDKKRRPSTVKSAESDTWLPLHEEAEKALVHQLAQRQADAAGTGLVFHGPRGGIVGSSLMNDALTYGCEAAHLGYRVTSHGLRHSIANWLKKHGVATPDIQVVMRHADARTTDGYLHTSDKDKTDAIASLPGAPHRRPAPRPAVTTCSEKSRPARRHGGR